MGKLINPVIVDGYIRGNCPKCSGPFEGWFLSPDNFNIDIQLECKTCDHVGAYFIRPSDLLPSVTLRHVSNGRALGQKSKKKTKNKNPDQVLRGQLSFPWGIR